MKQNSDEMHGKSYLRWQHFEALNRIFHDAKRTEEEMYPVQVVPLIMQLLLKLEIKHNITQAHRNAGLARSTGDCHAGGCEFEWGHTFTKGLKITD